MEERTIGRNGSSRKGSFRFGVGVDGKKDHSVVELGSIDTHKLLLSGGEKEKKQQPLTNSLSSRQMKSLSALCDSILPSVDHSVHTSDDSVNKFYRISASMAGTPELVSLSLYMYRKRFQGHISSSSSYNMKRVIYIYEMTFKMYNDSFAVFFSICTVMQKSLINERMFCFLS